MKIVIISCLKANEVCTGAACFNALNNREKSFKAYENEKIEIQGFMRCNGCGHTINNDEGMDEKFKRILSLKPDVVHFGLCTFNENGLCQVMSEIREELKRNGIETILGTH